MNTHGQPCSVSLWQSKSESTPMANYPDGRCLGTDSPYTPIWVVPDCPAPVTHRPGPSGKVPAGPTPLPTGGNPAAQLAASLPWARQPEEAMEKANHKLRLFFIAIPEVRAARGSGLEVWPRVRCSLEVSRA